MAKARRRKLFKKRMFLNPDNGIAALDAHVDINDYETYTSVHATLGLSDCSNGIYLDFDIWESSKVKKHLAAKRKKAAHVRNNVNAFLDAVEAAYDEVEAKLPQKEAVSKAQKKSKK